MSDQAKPSKVTTEGSARVLNEVMGRLERMDAGELPVIERVGPDGVTRRVDQTGQMIRPDNAQIEASRLDAVNEAAEAFAQEHHANPAAAPSKAPAAPSQRSGVEESEPPRAGLWERIKAWFRRA